MSASILSGKIAVADYSTTVSYANRQFTRLGNSSVLTLNVSEETKDLTDYQDAAGGLAASFKRVQTVTGQIDMRDITAANLALALWGTTAILATTAIVGEAHKIYPSAFIPTNRLINTTVAPVVKKGATTISTSDYTVSKAGILIASIISTGGVISGDAITIDYTPVAGNDVQALVNTAPLKSMHFEGVNQVDGKYVNLRIWQIKLGAPKNIAMIGDDFATLSMEFSVVKDSTIVSGSPYFTMEQES